MLTLEPLGPFSLAAKLRPSSTPAQTANDTTQNGYTSDGLRPSEAPIDPLSQVCPYVENVLCGTRLTAHRTANPSQNEYVARCTETAPVKSIAQLA
jgi:hypothetical protein